MDRLTGLILSSNIDTKENRKKHVVSIRKKLTIDKQKIRKGICPRCNSILIQRKGRYGSFIGCSNYPKCRYKVM